MRYLTKKTVLVLGLLFCLSAYSQVKFILSNKTQNMFCKKNKLQITMLVKNCNNKEIWVYKDMYYLPTKHFYLMIKREEETTFTKVSYCFFHAVWQKWFFQLKPNESKEITLLIHTSILPEKYLDQGILYRLVKGFFTIPYEKISSTSNEWVDVCPLKPGKYELYFVYDLNVDPVKYKLHDVLLGTYETNHVYLIVPSCSFTNRTGFMVQSLKQNKNTIFAILIIYGIIYAVLSLFVFLFSMFIKLLIFIFLKIRRMVSQ